MKKIGFLVASLVASLFASTAFADVAVKLGVLNDRSGVYSDLAGEGSVVAAQMAVEDYKAADKGITVEIISADHQNKPDIASNIARQWYDQDGVDAILDVPTSSAALAVAEITREKNKIFLNSGGGTSDLTGKACSPNTVHWTYDSWQLAHGTASAVVANGGKKWFFVTADYAFGQAMERDATEVVKEGGGEVVGSIRHPFPGTDFSSYLLQAQSSGAQVVAFANAGGDTINSVKQASEFGLAQSGQQLAGLLVFANDVHSLGLQTAQGLMLTESFYWDLNDQTREWSARFEEKMNKKPSMVQAGVYASVLHYLKAVEALGDKDATKVMAKMKETPTDDILFGKGMIRADGRKIHQSYLFQVKKPEESKGEWDLYNLVSTIPAEQSFRPLDKGGCSLIK
ncbi:ABC transporter substrate-binding protein [Tianweitania populi]|uniref:ABC transporter substrate-binding protein n=1 Tax=Tianweitania populi TaxID=1607949 RepID=A0A8J3DPV4_9HYPH|nr:ABC transporter substrate-binding protein [Tianweitania populi]GHD12710.1 ABC transporter substrate-binding protein [Tianweitania populi]